MTTISNASRQQENPHSNYYIAALPRSGSTWLSKRLEQMYGLQLYEEPLRRLCGDTRSKIYHATCMHDVDAEALLSGGLEIDSSEQERVSDHFSFLGAKSNILVKETVGLMQISFLKQLLPNYQYIFLRRHLCGSLQSHMNIPNMWDRWHYEDRIKIMRSSLEKCITQFRSQLHKVANDQAAKDMEDRIKRYKEYKLMCTRADDNCIFGDKRSSQLLAHLAIQSLECSKNSDRVEDYEDLCERGIGDDFLPLEVNSDVNELDDHEDSSTNYETHGTKNPPSPYKWIEVMDERAWSTIRHILGEHHHKELCPKPKIHKLRRVVEVPDMKLISIGDGIRISNRVVMTREFASFLNECLSTGMQDILKKLGMQDSEYSVQDKTDRILTRAFVSQNPSKPMILATPTACMAYAAFHGYRLPSKIAYDQLHGAKPNIVDTITSDNTNFAEDISKMTPVGYKEPINGFYDLYGNQKELCIDHNGKPCAVGGSYSDEKSQLGLDQHLEFSYTMRDERTGFRLQQLPESTVGKEDHRRTTMQIINSSKTVKELFNALLAKYYAS